MHSATVQLSSKRSVEINLVDSRIARIIPAPGAYTELLGVNAVDAAAAKSLAKEWRKLGVKSAPIGECSLAVSLVPVRR